MTNGLFSVQHIDTADHIFKFLTPISAMIWRTSSAIKVKKLTTYSGGLQIFCEAPVLGSNANGASI